MTNRFREGLEPFFDSLPEDRGEFSDADLQKYALEPQTAEEVLRSLLEDFAIDGMFSSIRSRECAERYARLITQARRITQDPPTLHERLTSSKAYSDSRSRHVDQPDDGR